MNYSETLTYLYEKLPMYSRMGSAAFRKDLTNIRTLCANLDDPHKRFPSVHVGGTNGKGSVSHMLASVLQAAGYKTGLYTSPHLYDFRERIRINGQMVEEGFVTSFVQRVQPLIEEIDPSFFEITVAMAFEYFAKEAVDIALIEVGLGGRLDSTNIIVPELSVITNIGWDHMQLLGNTLEEIAEEKGGIIKSGVPVLIGEKQPETTPVFEKLARYNKAPLFFAEDRWKTVSMDWKEDVLELQLENGEKARESYLLDLPGIYQAKNICTVRAAADRLNEKGYDIKEAHLAEGLRHTRARTGLTGRWEVLKNHPKVVLEVAHNKNGMEAVLQHLQHEHYRRLHIILGFVKDKEVGSVLELLPPSATYYFSQSGIPRALPAGELQSTAEGLGLHGERYEEVNDAVLEALKTAHAEDLILVCGSIFLVAEVNRESVLQFT